LAALTDTTGKRAFNIRSMNGNTRRGTGYVVHQRRARERGKKKKKGGAALFVFTSALRKKLKRAGKLRAVLKTEKSGGGRACCCFESGKRGGRGKKFLSYTEYYPRRNSRRDHGNSNEKGKGRGRESKTSVAGRRGKGKEKRENCLLPCLLKKKRGGAALAPEKESEHGSVS